MDAKTIIAIVLVVLSQVRQSGSMSGTERISNP